MTTYEDVKTSLVAAFHVASPEACQKVLIAYGGCKRLSEAKPEDYPMLKRLFDTMTMHSFKRYADAAARALGE